MGRFASVPPLFCRSPLDQFSFSLNELAGLVRTGVPLVQEVRDGDCAERTYGKAGLFWLERQSCHEARGNPGSETVGTAQEVAQCLARPGARLIVDFASSFQSFALREGCPQWGCHEIFGEDAAELVSGDTGQEDIEDARTLASTFAQLAGHAGEQDRETAHGDGVPGKGYVLVRRVVGEDLVTLVHWEKIFASSIPAMARRLLAGSHSATGVVVRCSQCRSG